MYYKGLKPSELHDDDACLVSCLRELPFQEGRPLSSIDGEGQRDIEPIDSSTDEYMPDRHVYMVSMVDKYTNELLEDTSADEDIASRGDKYMASADNTGAKDNEQRALRRTKNAKQA